MSPEAKFREIVRDTVTESISDALGESGMKALTFNVPLDLLFMTPGGFHESLRKIIKEATPVLEYLIIRDLSERLGVHPHQGESTLDEFLVSARLEFLNGRGRRTEGDLI